MLVMRSPLLESPVVKDSKRSSVSLMPCSLSAITLSTLRSATRIFSCVDSVSSRSAVSTGMPSAATGGGGPSTVPPVKRDRRNPGQALEFQPDQRVGAQRRVGIDQRQRHHAARVVELQRAHLADAHAGEIDAAAAAQAGGRALEHHVERHVLLDAGQSLVGDHPAERRADNRQRERADHQIAGAELHGNPSEPRRKASGFAAASHRLAAGLTSPAPASRASARPRTRRSEPAQNR